MNGSKLIKGLLWALAACVFLCLIVLLLPLIIPQARHVQRRSLGDPQVVAAMSQARRGLDGFIRQLQHPKPGQQFAIMIALPTDAGPEYLWCKDPTWKNGVFTATLDQIPMVAHVLKGSTEKADRNEVADWLIRNADGTTQGQFTSVLGQPRR